MKPQVFKGAVRLKDGKKTVFDVGNVETWMDALEALRTEVKDVQCRLVLVPKVQHVFEPELA